MKLDRCILDSWCALSPCSFVFSTLSDGSGSIDREEFLQIPQIATNPLASRMIAIFDEEYALVIPKIYSWTPSFCSGGGTVDFQEFVGGLSAFSSRGGREEKLKCTFMLVSGYEVNFILDLVAFKVYDVDRDGYISNGELFLVLKMMVGNNLKVRLLDCIPKADISQCPLAGSATATNS